MRDAAKHARDFAEGKSASNLKSDLMLAMALVKCIEIVGEAAGKVTEDTRKKHPDIPWHDMMGMRNRLIHAYSDINLDIVWKTLTEDLPPLLAMLEKALSETPNLNADQS